MRSFLLEKIALFCTHFGDRQTDERTNRWTEPMRKGALAVASGALTSSSKIYYTEMFSYIKTVLYAYSVMKLVHID